MKIVTLMILSRRPTSSKQLAKPYVHNIQTFTICSENIKLFEDYNEIKL